MSDELSGAELDAAVMKALGPDWRAGQMVYFQPSTNWAHGGPIIEREHIRLEPPEDVPEWDAKGWRARILRPSAIGIESGPTPLIAAMRAFVASRKDSHD